MSRSFDLDPVDRITAGAVGEPGQRTFYVQADARDARLTLLAEKDQVRILAQALHTLLARIDDEPGPEPPEEELELREPLDPQWRVGEMSIEYDEAADRVVITLDELRPSSDEDDEEEGEELPPEPYDLGDFGTARLVATRDQVRALAEHALEVVAAGRPRCQFCGYPLEPGADHVCPAMNGHGAPRPD